MNCPSQIKCRRPVSKGFLFGTICAVSGAAIFPISLVTAAMIPECNPITVLFLQAYSSYAFALSSLIYNSSPSRVFIKKEGLGVLLRGFSLTIASITSYSAIVFIPAGDVYALRFSNAIFVSLGGYLFLKEKFTKLQFVCVIGVVTGVFFITKPTYIFGGTTSNESSWIGVILSLVSCAFQTAELLFLRTTPKTPTQYKVGSSRFILTLACLFLMVVRSDYKFPGCGSQLLIVLAGIICIVLSNTLFDYASRYLKVGYYSLLRTSSVFFTYVYQIILLGLSPSWNSFLGAVIICSFVILSTLTEQKRQKTKLEPISNSLVKTRKEKISFDEIEDLPSTAV